MAIKTFTAGAILTASDTNTFLANAGLVYITGGQLSGSATNFEGCFSSTYRNYRVVVNNAKITGGNTDFCWQGLIGSTAQTATNYWSAALGLSAGNAAYNQNTASVNPGRTGASTVGTDRIFSLVMDIYGPNIADVTHYTSQFCQFQTDDFRFRTGAGGFGNSAQLTGLRLLSAGGQAFEGSVLIFGYRQA